METFETINKTGSKQNTAGNFFSATKNNLPFIQPKLTINQPNDVYEQEADAMADKVMRMEQPGLQLKALPITGIQRKCAHCEEEEKVQRKETNEAETVADSTLENYTGNLNSIGQPLPNEVRSFYEPRFGYDFSNVKVHTDSVAAKSAQSINALAYTSGNNIVFNNGQYSPNTNSGKKLLGHELTHVVQQRKDTDTPQSFVQRWDWGRAGIGALIGGGIGAIGGALVGGPIGAVAGGLGGAIIGGVIGGLSGGNNAGTCSSTKNVTVDFVRLSGATRSPSTDLAVANRVFRSCCVQFTIGKDVSISAADTQSWLGGDTDLNLSGITCGTPTAEESSMYNGATALHSLSSTLKVFYPGSVSGYPARAFSRPPYCAGGYSHHAVIYPSAQSDTLAHEFGHIYLNSATHSGIDNPADTRNLMVSPGRTASDLDATQCSIIYGNA